MDFSAIEHKILKFWRKNKIFERSINQRPKTRNFVFFEGPPTANGRPGIHHVLARVFKDVVCRYKTMQGFRVERKAGWDTHGLPVELEVEKKLGIKTKPEIEKYGIAKFNKACKKSVWMYKKEWEELTERIGFWLDMKNPYITYESNYIESVWWIIKQIWQKKLLYQDYKVVPYCPRCETGLSSHEVAQGYKKVKENSIYVKFPVKGQKNTFFLVWTTTPWTLPGNVALAINRKINYVKVEEDSEFLILAENRLNVLKGKYRIVDRAIGGDLNKFSGSIEKLGEYEQILPYLIPNPKKSFIVVFGDFVSDQDGTGIVHIAPAYGEDDMKLGKQLGLETSLIYLDKEGRFEKDFPWSGKFAKDADRDIIQELKSRNLFYKEEQYEHDYPFCWRCDSPLLYYAKKGWFINMQKVKRNLIRNSQKINWIPAHLKEGRFGEWLKEIKDWAISRERYWGTPLPIWQCEKCNEKICIGSIKELFQKSKRKIKDLHRPLIDKILFKCEKCGGKMYRVPEVLDCWFDSGSMPFAQHHYPFENKNIIDKKIQFPADYICEAIDQTRGWFYTLLAISTLLGFESPYKNVISVGHVLDEKGEKMSKSKGNIVSHWDMINKYGIDSVRWYFYTVNQPGEPKLFNEKDIDSALKRFLIILWNCFVFLETYKPKSRMKIKSRNLLDKWIISKLNNLIPELTLLLDKYDITSAARKIEDFAVNDLSQWYIRRSRRRFQKPETKKELSESYDSLSVVLLTLTKLLAPFIPFFAEETYPKFNIREKSVHLENWPRVDKKLINQELEEKMQKIREIVALALAERAKAGIKVRQPLASLRIKDLRLKVKGNKELLDLIKEEVNVKEIVFDSKIKKEVELDTKITSGLREEGIVREIIRQIQELRKQHGLKPKDKIIIQYWMSEKLNKIINKQKNYILKETLAKQFESKESPVPRMGKEIDLEGEKLWLEIRKT